MHCFTANRLFQYPHSDRICLALEVPNSALWCPINMSTSTNEVVPIVQIAAVLGRLTPDQRRRLGADVHMDDRTLRRCAAGRDLKSSSIARIAEGLRRLGLLTAP